MCPTSSEGSKVTHAELMSALERCLTSIGDELVDSEDEHVDHVGTRSVPTREHCGTWVPDPY